MLGRGRLQRPVEGRTASLSLTLYVEEEGGDDEERRKNGGERAYTHRLENHQIILRHIRGICLPVLDTANGEGERLPSNDISWEVCFHIYPIIAVRSAIILS